MTRYQVLYNPYASNNQGKIKAEALTDILTDYPLVYNDITKIEHLTCFPCLKDISLQQHILWLSEACDYVFHNMFYLLR